MKDYLFALDSLLRRGLASALIFFSLLFLGDFLLYELSGKSPPNRVQSLLQWTTDTMSSHSVALAIAVLVFAVIGLSFVLSALTELLFEALLRRNFGYPLRRAKHKKNTRLAQLRRQVSELVQEKLPQIRPLKPLTDYELYELVGGILATNTRGYVDSAKNIGTVTLSLALVFSILSSWYFSAELAARLLQSLVPLLILWLGLEGMRAQYRARALRLYLTFLSIPTARLDLALDSAAMRNLGVKVEDLDDLRSL